MLIKKRPEKLRSYTPTKTKKERQTVRNSHRKFSVKLNTEKFQLSKLYFKFDFYIRNYFELKLFKNRDIVYVHCPRDFLRAGILHPSALEIALGQYLGPRGAKFPALGKSLRPRGMYFPIHPNSRQCTAGYNTN